MCVCMQAIKYGVVSTSALLRDLWNWDSFYVAGRLHKPVLFLVRDAAVDRAVAANIDAALAAALLLLPARFTAKVCQSPIRCVRLSNECTDWTWSLIKIFRPCSLCMLVLLYSIDTAGVAGSTLNF